MKVLIQKGEKMAIKEDGQVCVINGLTLTSGDPEKPDTFISVDSPRFRLFCPSGTKHEYEPLPNGKINIL